MTFSLSPFFLFFFPSKKKKKELKNINFYLKFIQGKPESVNAS